ncbi:catecholate siderophore receptor Fiu [Paucibacter sp. R3-3]|uniref:Catecholate siderophore receptor Fiu n=1 Tax=Roseateles agri TaxID=3098619 RepID=A0ABU5DDY7_9BURK|nr:catecholate siderophore receptor Fiu [Paucibacter sp. R3-3]MDY0744493.1 catecholate siderophore receptor Fiu [Paucibacter sp. R3-3]
MSFIKSRKHAAAAPALAALAASLGAPLLAHAADTAKPTDALPTIKATADADVPYKSDVSSNTKYTAPLLNTPQTIQVIPEQVLREQNATNLTEALRNTPGVSTFFLGENGSTNTGDAIYMRGYDASSSIFVDGIRDIASVSRDTFNLGSVEVIKGPAGTDVGRSSPTGYINLITKKPTLENALSGNLGFGSASFKRGTVDVNRVLDVESGIALRLNAVVQDNGVAGRDEIKNKRWGIAPSLAIGLGTDTRIYLDAVHIKQDNIPDGGVPTIGLPGFTTPDTTRPYISSAPRVDPSNFYGTSSDFDNVKSDMLTARIEHDLKNGFKLTNTARYGRTAEQYMLTSWTAATANLKTPSQTDFSTWTIARSSPTNKDQINTIIADQLNFSGEVKTGGIKHSLSIGAEISDEKQQTWGYYGSAATVYNVPGITNTGSWTAANLYNPDPNATGYTRLRNGSVTQGSTTTVGAYLFDTIEITPQWLLSAGLRADHYSTDYYATTLVTATTATAIAGTYTPTSLTLSDWLYTGKIGLVYKPVENGSIYVDYATGAQPPGGSSFALAAGGSGNSANRTDFAPQKTKTYEIGTKWDLLDKTLTVTGALYRTDVLNQVVQDPTSLLYYQTGKQRVQGVEIGLVGQITKAWGVSLGLTTMDTKIVSGPAVTKDGSAVLAYTPKNAFTAWTTYDVGSGVTLGLGALHNGALHRGTDSAIGTPALVDGYTIYNAMASYKINRNITMQLNVTNLFDKDYIAAINKSGYRYTPGSPRAAQLTASMDY